MDELHNEDIKKYANQMNDSKKKIIKDYKDNNMPINKKEKIIMDNVEKMSKMSPEDLLKDMEESNIRINKRPTK